MADETSISRRAYHAALPARTWEEIFEAGPYYQRISQLLEDAQHYAIFVGWQIDSRLPLPHPPRSGAIESLREKLLRLVEAKPDLQLYFLMWDHAYFYVLERETWQGRIWDSLHPRIHFLFDNRHPFGGSHHEKVCIIDGNIAFCGGIDLCDERWDTPEHLYSDPRRSLNRRREHHGPYHDVAVQVSGPVCSEIHRHIQRRWRALSRVPFPRPAIRPQILRIHPIAKDDHLVYVSRTLAHIDTGTRRPIVREIEFLFRDLIRAAEHRIILEGQYYWSDEINDMLIAKMSAMRGKDFEIILVLASIQKLKALTMQMSLYELRLLDKLQTAARLANIKLTVGNPAVHPPMWEPDRLPKPIYIHSKVMIIDDRFISIGSANLATRALRLDTEINLTSCARTEAERAHVRRFSNKLLKHWDLIGEERGRSNVRFHPVNALEQIAQRKNATPPLKWLLLKWIPWKKLLDPKIPWFHPVERKLRRLSSSHFPWAAGLVGMLWLFSMTASVTLASLFAPHPIGHWDWAYAAILTTVWFSPTPFTCVAALSIYQIGFENGVTLSICALWVAALLGYSLTRLFPTYLSRFYQASSSTRLPKRLGLRRFPDVVAVSLDPRLSLRLKIAYPGLYCVPLPWFAMNLLLVLPGALYVFLRILHSVVGARPALAIQSAAPKILAGLLLYGFARLVRRFKSKGNP